MPEVSIVVPVYNAEKYLHRCIDSILDQTFPDFELILVDDGSTDTSGGICDEYAEKECRIKVIHQQNAGVSSARNKGIDESSGKYLLFCDSDDFVHPQWCEFLLRLVKENKDALCVCNFSKKTNSSSNKNIVYKNVKDITYFQLYKKDLSTCIWTKIYQKSIIIDNSLKFNENINISEDILFNTEYIYFCKRICYIDCVLYYYNCMNPDSITSQYHEDMFERLILSFQCRIPLISKNEISEYCDIWLYNFLSLFESVFDSRNKMSFIKKMKYNDKMIKSEAFRYCVKHASGTNENPVIMRILKLHNYYIFWLFQKTVKFKNRKKKNGIVHDK